MTAGTGEARIPRRFAWHWAVAAVSFTALAVLRTVDGETRAAAAFAALAAAAVLLTWARTRAARREAGTDPAPARTPGNELSRLRRTHEVYRSRLGSWRVIAVAAVVTTVGGLVLFPPLTLIAAPVALAAAFKQRRYARGHRVLTAELVRRGMAVAR
ncbi:hypothetical protein ACFYOG_21230 [Streptomyces sp. NPDC007818]|uniref:hypothetical protein n=1 Tax=Streptomyces sp. NPDC007818 TaxID=3364780 RepID=UPI003689B5FC